MSLLADIFPGVDRAIALGRTAYSVGRSLYDSWRDWNSRPARMRDFNNEPIMPRHREEASMNNYWQSRQILDRRLGNARGASSRSLPVGVTVYQRASRRLRQRLHRRVNRRRRFLRRRLRARRRARAHRRNPYTRHRHSNRRFIRSNIRRMRRRYRRGLIPARRINFWYSIGRHVLVGNYFGQDDDVNISSLNASYFPLRLAFHVANATTFTRVGSTLASGHQPLMVLGDYDDSSSVVAAPPLFNVHYATVPGEPWAIYNQYGPQSPNSNLVAPVSPTINFAVYNFRINYEVVNNLTDTETAYAVMPAVPSQMYTFTADAVNPTGYVGEGSLVTNVPYRCYWRYTYAKIFYAIKCNWPSAWSNLTPSSITPPNPPLYVRLIGITLPSVPVGNQFSVFDLIKGAFGAGAPIYAKISNTARRALYSDYGIKFFFDKTWMFNGRITPQFQAAEVLTDGEESSFVVRIPLGYTNAPQFGDGQRWKVAKARTVQFIAFAAFDCPQFKSQNGSSLATLYQALTPNYSVFFAFQLYCFPKLRAPDTVDMNHIFAANYGSQYTMRSYKATQGADGNVVAADVLETPPTLGSKGSSSSASAIFDTKGTSEVEKTTEKESTTEVSREAQESPLLCTTDSGSDTNDHQCEPHESQQILSE